MVGSRHTKRFNTGKYIHINKKESKFFLTTRPGSHPKNNSLPLLHVLRDLLKLVKNGKEGKKIIRDIYRPEQISVPNKAELEGRTGGYTK